MIFSHSIAGEAWGNTLMNAKKTEESLRVPCYPLYSILAALGNPVIDYMSLDVEGVEMKVIKVSTVLKNIPWDDVKIRVITIEIFLLPEGPEALRTFMEEKGFKFIKQLNQDYLFINKQLSGGGLERPSSRQPERVLIYYLDNPRQKFYSQHGQYKHVKEIFRDMKRGSFFEVGALTGESLSNTLYLERELGWTGVLMEPTPVSYHVLKSKNRRAHIMRACLAPDTSYREPVSEFVIHARTSRRCTRF
ncbi:hypothetical protein HAZT_HAZT001497, partial [Hyalella azteca]